jgi:hypothetical protein
LFDGSVRVEGNLSKTGDFNAVVPTSEGAAKLSVTEAPDAYFVDYGDARTEKGQARVYLDPLFAETVDLAQDYYVFLTPTGGGATLAVKDRTARFFDAVATGDTRFTYKIVAVRRGYADKRFVQ